MQRDTARTTRKRIVQHADMRDARVLEIGCGPGRVTAMLSDLPELLVGLDPNPDDLLAASALVPRANFACASGHDLPFVRACFDVVLFSLSLHHHCQPEKALQQARRVLRPGGTILVLEPAVHSEVQRMCSIFEDEDDRLLKIEQLLRGPATDLYRREEFRTTWLFSDFGDVQDYAFDYYDQPRDARRIQALRDFLGQRAGHAPLEMSDTLRLTCIRPAQG